MEIYQVRQCLYRQPIFNVSKIKPLLFLQPIENSTQVSLRVKGRYQFLNIRYIMKQINSTDHLYFGISCIIYLYTHDTFISVVVPKSKQGNKEHNSVLLFILIPVVLIGGSLTIVGLLARVKGITIGKKTPLKAHFWNIVGYS